MKVIATVFGALALVGAVTAQSAADNDFNSLPQCGKTCIDNLLNQAPSFGCTAGSSNEANCLCANQNFTYGVRDCSNEACLNATAASAVIAYGIDYCSSAGVSIPTTIETVTSGTISPSVTRSAITTSSYLTTLTTDGSTLTTSEATTIFAGGAASSTSSGASSTASSKSSAASSSLSSAISSAISSASSHASSAASGSSTGGSGSSTSSAFAPQITAAPVGFLAAAGVAAMLL